MTKPLVPADLLKNLQAMEMPAADTTPDGKPKVKPHVKPAPKTANRPQGKSGGAAHMRSSNRGK